MKTYARGRTSKEFIKAARAAGLRVSTRSYNAGGDWLAFNGKLADTRVTGLFNVVNSRVIGTYGPKKTDFSTDQKLDGLPWFDAVLDLANTDEPRQVA